MAPDVQLAPFQKYSKTREDIQNPRFTTDAANTGGMWTIAVNLLLVANWQTMSLKPAVNKAPALLLVDSSDQQFQISFTAPLTLERIVYSIASNSVKALRTII